MDIIHAPTEQTRHVLLAHLQANLRSSREMEPFYAATSSLRSRLETCGFDGLAEILNASELATQNQQFKWKDFRYCSLHPDDRVSYQAAHTLSPASLVVAMPLPKWETFQRRAGIQRTARGCSYDEYAFAQGSGLERTGISFHLADGYQESIFFELLYHDIHLYNPIFSSIERLSPQTFRHPFYLGLAIEYKTIRDLVGGLYEPAGQRTLSSYLSAKLEVNVQVCVSLLDTSRVPDASRREAETVFRTLVAPAAERIPCAVEAAYALRNMLGMQLLVPVLYSLGSTQEEFRRNALFSPLKGIVQWRKYLEAGDITPEQISEVLYRKGYLHTQGVN